MRTGSYYGSSGSIGGAFSTPVSKMWSIFNSFGILFFAWGCAFVLVEIVNTIKDGEPDALEAHPVREGRKAFNYAYVMVAVILFTVAITTYGSVGDDAPGWFLNAFESPQWLLIMANLVCAWKVCNVYIPHCPQAIVLSLIPGYNLYLLPFLLMVERAITRRFPRMPRRVLMIVWRSFIVLVLAVIGALVPFFSSFISLVGAIGFVRGVIGLSTRCHPSTQWPITIYFPLEMFVRLYNPSKPAKIVLYSVSVFSFLVTLVAIVGSVESIVESASTFTFGWQ